MQYYVPINDETDLDIDIDTYSLLREEPEFMGVDENEQLYELSAEQMAIVMVWFEKNKDKIYKEAFQSVAND